MNTIAAVSTALSKGGVGMVRVSGEQAIELADRVFTSISGKKLVQLKGYQASYGFVSDMEKRKIDEAVALVYRAPKSYTGENVVELTCHGGIYIMKKLLQALLDAGAVPAEAGEFTKRAFMNGKMDLTQAESVMQLVSAKGEQALRAALSGNSGFLSKRIEQIKKHIQQIASHLTAWVDFPEEDVPEVKDEELRIQFDSIGDELQKLDKEYDRGKMLREGIPTVIAGRTNVGKSTIMNLLSGTERSIVTEYEGTTRDVVEETIMLGETMLCIADTAGIRETEDPVEKIGVVTARRRMKEAQLVLAVFDASRELDESDGDFIEQMDKERTIALVNKTDLHMALDMEVIRSNFKHVVLLSAKNEEGLDELEEAVRVVTQTIDFDVSSGILFTERQRKEVSNALRCIKEAKEILISGMTYDAVTICVESALESLLSLTGEKVSENIIEEVFSTFCVGK